MVRRTSMSLVKVLCFFTILHCISAFVLQGSEEKDEEIKDFKRIIELLRKEKLQKLANVHIDEQIKTQRNAEEEEEPELEESVEEEEVEHALSLFENSETRGLANNNLQKKEDGEQESEEEEVENEELEERSIDMTEGGHGADIDGDVEPEDEPELFSLLNSFLDEKDGVKTQGAGLNKTYKAQKDRMDSHKLTHWQKVELGLESEHPGEEKRNFVTNTNTFWPQGIVPYEISTSFSTSQRAVIEGAIAEMTAKTCVRFLPRGSTDPNSLGHSSYINFFSESGCWSYVGRVFSSKQDLSLQAPGCVTNSITIHEMCHAIGQMHEQSRSDRDNYVTMLWNNIQGGQGNNNMIKDNTLDNNNYDHESVLQYSLTAFSTNGQPTMEFKDRRLDFLADSAGGLTFYDVKDITAAYQCAQNCAVKLCENGGFQDHTCQCLCPDGLMGDLCEQVDTDNICGGIIDVSSGPATIQSPNYPANYNVDTGCTWLVKTNPNEYVRLDIDDLHLSDNGAGRCYHWLEVQYNLLGQTGPRRCGDVAGENYITSVDGNQNLMLLRFDSKFSNDRPSSQGFSLRVRSVLAGCSNNPCYNGGCSATQDGQFTCTCYDRYTGVTCDIPPADASFSCGYDNNEQCFLSQATDDQFDWTTISTPTPSSGTGPDQAQSGNNYLYAEMSSPRVQGDVARMVSHFDFTEMPRCLRFWYFMFGSTVGQLAVAVSGTTAAKSTVWSLSGDQGQSWNLVSLDIASTAGLRIFFEATRGSSWNSDIAIDTLELTPGSCSGTTQAPTTPAPTTPAPTTPAPTTPAPTTTPPPTTPVPTTQAPDACTPNPCNNGGTCVINNGAVCSCAAGFAGQFCDSTVAEFYHCTFENANAECFLRDATNDDYDWTLNSGSTPSSGTGPSSAQSGANYIYFEVSSPVTNGDTALLETYTILPAQDRCLSFWYSMNGPGVGSLIVSTSSSGALWTRSGDQGNAWIRATLDLPMDPNFQLFIEASRGSHWNGDIALDEIELTDGLCPVLPCDLPTTCLNGGTCLTGNGNSFSCVCDTGFTGDNCENAGTTLPPSTFAPGSSFSCTFEAGVPCFLHQESLDDFDWTFPESGSTPSSSTGPDVASEGTFYAYIETSSPRTAGDTAVLMSDILPLENFCLTFDYHMYGSSMGTLGVLVNDVGANAGATMSLLWEMSGDQGNAWHNAAIEIPPTPSLRVFFEGIRGGGYRSDAAIDNVIMRPGSCGCDLQPCQNGGSCSEDLNGQITCVCGPGFTGAFCESFDGSTITCSFEDNENCFLMQDNTDDFDWTITSGSTPSSNTGPSAAFEGNKYAYIEASSPRVALDVAEFSADLNANAGEFCLTFAYHMHGESTGSLEISQTSGQQLVTLWSKYGNVGNFWQSTGVQIQSVANTKIIISGVRGSGFKGDIAIDNVGLKSGLCGCLSMPCLNGGTCTDAGNNLGFTCSCDAGFSGTVCESPDGSVPITCTFEDGDACFLQQVNALDDFNWSFIQGSTPSSNTGPDGAHTGSKYAYIEASSRQDGDFAVLSTEQLTFQPMERCLRFYYHMNGDQMGSLHVYAGERGQETMLWSEKGDLGDQWLSANVDIPSATDLVVAMEGVCGTSFKSDIAVDDIELSAGLC